LDLSSSYGGTSGSKEKWDYGLDLITKGYVSSERKRIFLPPDRGTTGEKCFPLWLIDLFTGSHQKGESGDLTGKRRSKDGNPRIARKTHCGIRRRGRPRGVFPF